jgi:tripartite-type tricarboxylate transporter receptor subunit TctC
MDPRLRGDDKGNLALAMGRAVNFGSRTISIAMATLASASSAAPACAQSAADFYRGKTINLIAGFNPGGGADTYARIVARHLGRHIAGGPAVIVRNMQGAGSVLAANPSSTSRPRTAPSLACSPATSRSIR